jgi:LysR family nod box-dependent transcriptional activator
LNYAAKKIHKSDRCTTITLILLLLGYQIVYFIHKDLTSWTVQAVRLNKLDLNLLIALDALLSEQSITLAADRICLSQPATSGALARLRDFFDDELLVRVGSKMQPTPLGESLADPVHNILLQIQTTVERGVAFDPASCMRNFKFYVGDYNASVFMSDVAKRVMAQAPGVTMEFFIPANKPVEELERGQIDFLIMPERVLHKEHPYQTLFTEDFVCIACENNDIVHTRMTVEEYMQLGHVSVQFGSNRLKSQDQILLKMEYDLEPRLEIITSTFHTIPQFLPGTQRVATVYQHLAEYWQQLLPLKIVPLPMQLPSITWALQWHKYRDHDPGLKWMCEQALATAKARYPTA